MDPDVFDRTLVEVAALLPAYFGRRVSGPAIAEDLTQETLLKALRARCTLRDETRVEAWVYGIAQRTLVDHYRRKSTVVPLREEIPHDPVTASDDIRTVLVASARCYLETLPGAYRDPVYLAEYEGLAHWDVARTLGLSLAATKSRVRRGRLMVRHLMEARCEFEYDGRGNIIGYRVRQAPGAVVGGR